MLYVQHTENVCYGNIGSVYTTDMISFRTIEGEIIRDRIRNVIVIEKKLEFKIC
jgi:hypothetical protein